MKTPRQIWRILRRRAFEACGSSKYSRPSFNALDRKFEKYLDFDRGFFIEAGANDGFEQSNTYHLEKWRRWSGVLVEPIPELYRACRRLRKGSKVFNAALVSSTYKEDSVLLHFAGLMSTVENALGKSTPEHIQAGLDCQKIPQSYDVRVPARTLTSILEEANAPKEIDFFSLDVEGFEAEALAGLDFSKYRPRYLCIEVRDVDKIEAVISSHYRRVAVLSEIGSHRDIFYEAL